MQILHALHVTNAPHQVFEMVNVRGSFQVDELRVATAGLYAEHLE
jgi:hypothetical protein